MNLLFCIIISGCTMYVIYIIIFRSLEGALFVHLLHHQCNHFVLIVWEWIIQGESTEYRVHTNNVEMWSHPIIWKTKRQMSFLKKLLRLGGCTRISKEPESSFARIDDECCECVTDDNILSDLQYIPWSSPGIGRRLVEKVKDSPLIARKMITKMTSPGFRRRKRKEEEDIFIVSVNVVHSSGSEQNQGKTTRDVW